MAHEAECLAACPPVVDGGVADAGATDGALPPSPCAQLGSICHDATSTIGVECHDLGHRNDAVMCAARYEACRAECSPRDAGVD